MKDISTKILIPVSIIAVIFLLVSNISIWINRTIYDRQAFSNLAVEALQKPETRDAIGAEVVDKAFADFPVAKTAAGNVVKSAVSGIMGSDLAKPIIKTVAVGFNALLTTNIPKETTIDLTAVKGFLTPIAQSANTEKIKAASATKIPDKITIFERGQIPSINSWASVLLWLGPILGLMGIGLIALMFFMMIPEKRNIVLKINGYSIAIGSIILIILIPSFKSPLFASITNENIVVVADSIYSVFTGILIRQTFLMLLIGALLVYGSKYLERLSSGEDKIVNIFSRGKKQAG